MAGTRVATPIVSTCAVPGCEILTIGPVCVAHDRRPRRTIVRGRPFVRSPRGPGESAPQSPGR